jgi:2-polyprenyl-6-methoxyphenol hydroxylase-like FAD-dependent oxidoreductase
VQLPASGVEGHEMSEQKTTCVIVGGGPAGMVAGLPLARGGVQVAVLEKHADFLRDFRRDTVHPSTLQLLDELGVYDKYRRADALHHTALPKVTKFEQVGFDLADGRRVTVADFTRLRLPQLGSDPSGDTQNVAGLAGRALP